MIYKTKDSLEPIRKLISEADKATNDSSRTINTSDMSELLGAVGGMGAGMGVSYAALVFCGEVGLSAVGITSGLASAGALVGGGMVAGIGVLTAPVAVLGIVGYATLKKRNSRKLLEAKTMLFKEIMRKIAGINEALNKEVNQQNERIEYLKRLLILLESAQNDLSSDLS